MGSATGGAQVHHDSAAVRRSSVLPGTLDTDRWAGCDCGTGRQIWPDMAGSGSCDGGGVAWSVALHGAGGDGGYSSDRWLRALMVGGG